LKFSTSTTRSTRNPPIERQGARHVEDLTVRPHLAFKRDPVPRQRLAQPNAAVTVSPTLPGKNN
jgi:hypothetical protein